MLHLPDEYTNALEEVLNQSLSRQALEGRKGRPFVEGIAKVVQTISKGLTQERGEFLDSAYLARPEIQKAYLTYYTTTNLLKIWPPLRELALSGFFDNRSSLNHLDLGSGTGAALWGLASYLKHEQPGIQKLATTATDVLPQNLSTIQAFLKAFQPRVEPLIVGLDVSSWDLAAQDPVPPVVRKKAPYDLITLMNVVNEIDESHDDRMIQLLLSLLSEGGALILIEPSTREQSRRALRFRDRLVQAGATVYAPCTRTNGCPALLEEDNWCHTEVKWERPPFIHAIDDVAGTLRLSLKFTYSIFLNRDLNLSDIPQGKRDFFTSGRVVSELFNEKGRARMFVCNERGRLEYQMNKRDKSGSNRAVLKTDRYDLIQIEGVEVREKDVKVTDKSVVNILNHSDGCGNVDKSI